MKHGFHRKYYFTFQQNEQPAPPKPQYVPPPYYDTMKQQEHVAEEAYWARRIENLKRAHEKINSGMHLEYQKTLKEANDLFALVQADKVVNKLPPCQDEKSKVNIKISFTMVKMLFSDKIFTYKGYLMLN